MLKKEGFLGQRVIVLPEGVLARIKEDSVNQLVFITHIGYYPNALLHHHWRKSGAEQHILIYCVSGQGWSKIDTTTYSVSPHQFVVIPKGTPHTYAADSTDPWSIYWVHFTGSIADVVAQALFAKLQEGSNAVRPNSERTRLFNEMYQNLEQGYARQLAGYANVLLWHYIGTFLHDGQVEQVLSAEEDNPISLSIQFILANLHTKFTVQTIADEVRLSASHFSLVFRQQTGYSPIEYVNHLRIQKACQMLQFSDRRVNEVSTLIGFEDAYYFTRLFSKIMGITPTGYRKQKTLIASSHNSAT